MSRRVSVSDRAGRAAPTLDQLISASNAQRRFHVAAGDDFRKLKATNAAFDRSMRWLRKNRNSADGSDVSRHEQLVESNRSGRMQWKELLRLDKKVRDKSKKDAPARLFLMLIELFSEFEREPMTYE